MRALHLCFWLHHPYGLMESDHWQKGYFGGAEDFKQIDQKEYQPLFALLERNAQRYPKLRVSLAVSGVWLEQAERWDNDLIKRLKKLVQNHNVGLVSVPYYYSVAAFYDLDELGKQLQKYQEKIEQLFGVKSDFLALPELLYNNRVARWADKNNYQGVLSGDAVRGLDWRTANRIYEAKGTDGLKVLFKNQPLSDDIALAKPAAVMETSATVKVDAAEPEIAEEKEMSAADFVRNMASVAQPTAQKTASAEQTVLKTEFSARKFQKQLDLAFLRGNIVNLYLDTNIFSKWREMGIIGFFDELFKIWNDVPGSHLVSVQEIAKLTPIAEISIKKTASQRGEAEQDYKLPDWWTPTQDQKSQELYALRKMVIASEDEDIYQDFARLTDINYATGGTAFAVILSDLQDKLAKLVVETKTENASEPVRFGLSESTSVQINFDKKAKEDKERNRSFYQQMKEAAGDTEWSAEDLDDMEAAIQVMAQRMKMSRMEQERDFADFAEAEIIGTEDDFADIDDIDLMAENLEQETPKAKNSKKSKDGKKSFKKIVID